MDEEIRLSYQDQLVAVIMRVLVANPVLHYYQGYHDICVTFLLVVGDDITFAVMDKLSNRHFRLVHLALVPGEGTPILGHGREVLQ